MLCLKFFGLGFRDRDPVIYQDNQGEMLEEKHDKGASGKLTCHIDVHHYFVKDHNA